MTEERALPSRVTTNFSEKALASKVLREGWHLHQRLRDSKQVHCEFTMKTCSPINQEWIHAIGANRINTFPRRLEWDELKPEMAEWALQPQLEATPTQPEWYLFLCQIRTGSERITDISLLQSLTQRCSDEPFVHAWRPLVAWALSHLQERFGSRNDQLMLSTSAWVDLGEHLLRRICSITARSMWQLFSQHRTPGQALYAYIKINSKESNGAPSGVYQDFIKAIRKNGYHELLEEFPVLGRLISRVTQLWIDFSHEMLTHIAESRAELQDSFGISNSSVLYSVETGLGDPHRGGRSVAALLFRHDNKAKKIAYKPKDIRLDAAYQDFLGILNQNSKLTKLQQVKTLTRDGYGFMEWIEHQTCGSDDQLHTFYYNAGRLLAILFVLGCSDCHYENLVADGEQLVLIDAETLLEPQFSPNGNLDDIDTIENKSIGESVLRTGLLPQWQAVGEGRGKVIDISALGIQPPSLFVKEQGWQCINTDGMLLGPVEARSSLPTSLPVGLGCPQQLTRHSEVICNGFSQQLDEIILKRNVLLNQLKKFKGKSRRVVPRSTRLYSLIQRQMLEPNALRDSIAQGLRLEQLCRTFLLSPQRPRNWQLFDSEISQLVDLDIPFFQHKVDGKDLPLPQVDSPVTGLISTSGLDCAQTRLEKLDYGEIEFQKSLIRGAIASRYIHGSNRANPKREARNSTINRISYPDLRSRLKEESVILAKQLWASAVSDRHGHPSWIGIDIDSESHGFRFGLVGYSLFSGSLGIATLFARLAILESNEIHAEVWRQRAAVTMAPLIPIATANSSTVSKFVRDHSNGLSGLGGIILGLYLMHTVGIDDSMPVIERIVDELQVERIARETHFDVMTGLAGLIGPLLLIGTSKAREIAVVCGRRLVQLQLPNGAWTSDIGQNTVPLTGFSHGSAGAAAALAVLANATGDEQLATAACRALDYEQSVFVAKQGNWPDFRDTTSSTDFMVSWCHGAGGILLSRLIVAKSGIYSKSLDSDIKVSRLAIQKQLECTTRRSAAHLCCGVLGLDWIMRIDAELNDVDPSDILIEVETCLLESSELDGGYIYLSVDDSSISLPGLFTGKAGVAFAMAEHASSGKWIKHLLSAGLLCQA